MDNDEVDLWATDEVHFQQHGSRCRMWVPPETKDPVLLHHPTRRSVGYFGAVRLRDGKFRFSRETGKFNAMTFFAFLKMLRRTSIRSGRSVVVVSACTTDAFLRWRKSSLPWKHSLDIGLTEMRPCVGYAQLLKTLRIVRGPCRVECGEEAVVAAGGRVEGAECAPVDGNDIVEP